MAPEGTYLAVSSAKTTYSHSCAVGADGAVICWGDAYYTQSSPPDGTFAFLDVGLQHSCAIDAAGALACWGYNATGLITTLPEGPFVAVTSGAEHICALGADGALACWGNDVFGQVTVP